MTRRRTRVLAALLTAGGFALAACTAGGSTAGSTGGPDRPHVVAAFYPLAYAAEQVGGDAIAVDSLTPPGVEPHDLELSAAQVAQIAEADLVLYVKGFQPAVDEAVAQQAADRAIDVSAGLDLLADDPHVWLAPANMARIGDAVAERVATLAPDDAAGVAKRAAAFDDAMSSLDADYRAGLATCTSRNLVVSHDAFGYLAAAYDLTQVGLSGLSPESEPSPARLADVAAFVEANDVSTIYYETLVDPKVAQTVADETGATTAVLDPLEGLAPDSTGDYASIMRTNLATLRTGQGCT